MVSCKAWASEIQSVEFAQEQLDWISYAFCSIRFYLLKLVFTLHLRFGKVLTEKANFGFVKFCNVVMVL